MSMFPGYEEIACSFCENYRHVKKAELVKLQKTNSFPGDPESFACDRCLKLVQAFVPRALLGDILDFIGSDRVVDEAFAKRRDQLCSRIRIALGLSTMVTVQLPEQAVVEVRPGEFHQYTYPEKP